MCLMCTAPNPNVPSRQDTDQRQTQSRAQAASVEDTIKTIRSCIKPLHELPHHK